MFNDANENSYTDVNKLSDKNILYLRPQTYEMVLYAELCVSCNDNKMSYLLLIKTLS
jgi:hypothetical protein